MPILDSDYITQFDEREDDDTDQAANKPVEEVLLLLCIKFLYFNLSCTVKFLIVATALIRM